MSRALDYRMVQSAAAVQDVYTQIADRVRARVEADASVPVKGASMRQVGRSQGKVLLVLGLEKGLFIFVAMIEVSMPDAEDSGRSWEFPSQLCIIQLGQYVTHLCVEISGCTKKAAYVKDNDL